ncbi:DNA ligase D [Trinickia fusca]|uniref:DNA ligase (ATP) n=1 Tax=Trinickia fusca TaxID=2419777 RepID=A0A494XCU6_9BURK|nr:DNA ligase D [Trinickia fusca]RKP45969.1 DNA ligase D [Trinickia fusca]
MAGRLDKKRRFDATPEPSGERPMGDDHALSYVIQEHHARRLHYDFRLELDGTLHSWAVPKGPCLDPSVKRLAVHVEDHPLEYGTFEGEIPEGNYGAGTVIVWDRGTWEPVGGVAQAREGYEAGRLKFTLNGEKLHGRWALVRSSMHGSCDKEQWLLIKERDEEARSASEYDVVAAQPGSVLADRGKRKPPDIVATRTSESLRVLAASPSIEGAVKAPLPVSVKPQLATLVDTAPRSDEWSYEVKFDGYRVLARIDHAATQPVRIFTRNGLDWSAKFLEQSQAFATLDVHTAWIDGEAVVFGARGVPSFQALQNALDANRSRDIVVFVFDLLYLNGYDLRGVPLVQRRALLRALMEPVAQDTLRFSEDFMVDADALLQSAGEMGLEGIIGKRRDSRYTSTRSGAWVKLRCRRRQEFVIGGYSDPSGSRVGFGALLLGVYDGHGALKYAGRVGTGFDTATLRALRKALNALETQAMPFATMPAARGHARSHWVRPELVAECSFAEWTSEGSVRQASFIGWRRDKPASEIVREAPRNADEVESTEPEPAKPSNLRDRAGDIFSGIRITHPDRLIDKTTGLHKLDLVRYFEWVAPWMLPHVKGRPIALTRAPDGIDGELFFQKHSNRLSIPYVTMYKDLDPGHAPLMTVDSEQALVSVAQMGTIELHTWNALASNIDKPDRIVFDLDPDPSLGWQRMIEAAQLMRSLLDELGLQSWCKTSGGKGLHVVVPLAKHASWAQAKAFAQAAAQHMADTLPERFSAKMGAQNRQGRIFIDYLRNNRGASTVAAYSPRARPGLGVSVPLSWEEVDATTGGAQWTVENVHQRLDALRADPWADYASTRQRITREMRMRLGMRDGNGE